MSIVIEAQSDIKQYIRNTLTLEDTRVEIFKYLNMMDTIVSNLKVSSITKKKNSWWNRAFLGEIGVEKLDFSVLNKQDQYIKTQLNSLQALIDILGSILTGRPLTSLSAYYVSGNKGYHVQASPQQFFQIQEAANFPHTVSLQAIRTLVEQQKIQIDEDNRLMRTLTRLKGENRGYITEAYDSAKRTAKRLGKNILASALKEAKGRTPWIKKGDNEADQVKFLGVEGEVYKNGRVASMSLTTASNISIEEITTYFTKVLKPSITQLITDENIKNKQVDAIYNAFVDAENIKFYGQGFDKKATDDLLEEIVKRLKNTGINISSIS